MEGVIRDFIWYLTNNESWWEKGGTAQPFVRVSESLSRKLAIPSLDEQRTISAFLDRETAKIDALVAEQEQLIALLKEKRQAVISHAVTKGLDPTVPMKDSGVDWLGEVPAHWKIARLSKLVSTRKGIAFKAEFFCDDGVMVVKASDIKNLAIKTPNSFLPVSFCQRYPQAILQFGEIILSTVGSAPEVKNSAVGQIGRVPNFFAGTLLNQNTVVVRPGTGCLLDGFLFVALQTTGYRDHLGNL
jgi:type I restriction enzyme S subunit